MLVKTVYSRSKCARGAWLAGCVALCVIAGPALSQESVLVEVGDSWRVFKGTVAPPVDWTTPVFDDLSWIEGASGVGYGDADDATVLDDMEDGYVAFFARRTFTASGIGSLTNLVLQIDYDDGFVAYLNGTEIARRGLGTAGSVVAFDQLADPGREAGPDEYIDASVGLASLVEGSNVLAIELHNTTLDSSDASLIPRLIGNGSLPPTNLGCARTVDGPVDLTWTNSQVYDSIEVTRNGAVIATLAGTVVMYSDASPGALDATYQVNGVVGALSYPSTNTCAVNCTSSTLTCLLSLDLGATRADVSWTPIAGVTTVEVRREGALVATLTAGETSYVDPNVEDAMPEDDTDFAVTQIDGGGGRCTTTCNPSLCPDNLTVAVVGGQVILSWGNMVKSWDHFEISRNGTVVDAAVPGTAIDWIDPSIVLTPGSSYDYLLHPIATVGGELPAPGDQCDEAVTLAYVPELGSQNPPAGGWDYIVDFAPGDADYVDTPGIIGNLDGQWIRSSDKDSWDGSDTADLDVSAPDGPAPGGIDIASRPGLGACATDTSVLRILDPGDTGMPIGKDFPIAFTAPNNSTLLLGLDLGSQDQNLLKSGITIATRLRTSPEAPAYMNPNPASGDGGGINGGIGQVGVYWRANGVIPDEGATAGAAFALASGDNGGDVQVSTNPVTDLDAAGISKFIALWMTVQGGATPDTYDVKVYVNGSTTPSDEMGGTAVSLMGGVADFGAGINNYIAIGSSAVGDDAMIDIDYVAYKLGVHAPSTTPCEGGGEGQFRRGDANASGDLNITDGVFILNYLFLGGPTPTCLDAADSDDNGSLNITDGVRVLNFLFLGGPEPPAPGTANCGPDPVSDDLATCVYESC